MKLYVASAGTGKTHTLVEELLALVKGGVPLRRIAAVTFTRKAAEELRARARKGVEALAREEPGLGGAVREVHGAVFGTIHAAWQLHDQVEATMLEGFGTKPVDLGRLEQGTS